MTNEDYIGKKLSECPDGTVAATRFMHRIDIELRMLREGFAERCTIDGKPMGRASPADEYTVVRILKLGKPWPKTLADCPAGEAWSDGRGSIWWRDTTSDVCVINPMHDFPQATRTPGMGGPIRGRERTIGPDWTRLGQITGLLIDGKPWPAKDGDE